MPNWCSNTVYVKGEQKVLDTFIESCKGKSPRYKKHNPTPKDDVLNEHVDAGYEEVRDLEFTFNALVPVPEEVCEKGYSAAGYNWQCDNWGTKWDACDSHVCERDGQITISFETAWSPAERWVEKVSAFYPELEFEHNFEEPGCMYAGINKYKAGEQTECNEVDADEYKEFVIEHFGYTEEDFDEEEEY